MHLWQCIDSSNIQGTYLGRRQARDGCFSKGSTGVLLRISNLGGQGSELVIGGTVKIASPWKGGRVDLLKDALWNLAHLWQQSSLLQWLKHS